MRAGAFTGPRSDPGTRTPPRPVPRPAPRPRVAEQVTAPDIPVDAAVRLARRATPGMLDDLLA